MLTILLPLLSPFLEMKMKVCVCVSERERERDCACVCVPPKAAAPFAIQLQVKDPTEVDVLSLYGALYAQLPHPISKNQGTIS